LAICAPSHSITEGGSQWALVDLQVKQGPAPPRSSQPVVEGQVKLHTWSEEPQF
jgi:hypothetical protein